jgi:hypothetical protein
MRFSPALEATAFVEAGVCESEKVILDAITN